MQVLYEDNHLLILNKPADWIVQGAGPGQRNLLVWAADYIRVKYHKPGNVFIGVVSRLDAPVTGVMPLARTSKSAQRLSEQFREQTTDKCYWALVGHKPKQESGILEHYLVRPPEKTITTVGSDGDAHAKRAVLEYRVVGENSMGYEIEIRLITGRKHQIRAQLQAIGCSILGDRKYGSSATFPHGIALHCRRVGLIHPTLQTQMTFTAPLPNYWNWTRPTE